MVTTTPNGVADPPDAPAISFVQSPLTAGIGHAQVVTAPSMFGGDPDYFMQWAIEWTPLVAAGFNPANPTNYNCGSANSNTLGADCSGSAFCPGLDTQFTDSITCGPLGCAICGDGQKGANEGCDDGNQTNGDGCNDVCRLELGQPCAAASVACASGFCDPAGDICACETHADCPVGQFCSVTPNPNVCVMGGCGNDILEANEGCDDGNTTPGDGCNAVCLKELGQTCVTNIVCVSGFCDPDGNVCVCDETADCPLSNLCNVVAVPNACVAPGCGNNVLEVDESCATMAIRRPMTVAICFVYSNSVSRAPEIAIYARVVCATRRTIFAHVTTARIARTDKAATWRSRRIDAFRLDVAMVCSVQMKAATMAI
jgi:cysteine-rich repeat protein